MPALVQYAYEEFTGPNINSRPRLPAFIPVPRYDRRFHSGSFGAQSDGTTVNTWTDTEVSLTNMSTAGSGVTGATAPILGTVSGNRVVRFDGIKNALGILYTNPEPYTFTLVFYQGAANLGKFLVGLSDSGAIGLVTDSPGLPKFWGRGQATSSAPLSTGWHIITVIADEANTRIRVDDNSSFTYSLGQAYERRRLTLGGSPYNTALAKIDVAEIVHWPSALSISDVEKVHSTFKSRYSL
ncbi:MAG TPA: hypothetical protein DCY59_08705 [Micrococcaceae bacterium]|nr:hypothetical protein [Micrococcaceae bacterium]